MNKTQQLENLKKSIQNGIETELQLFIENLDMGDIYEHHVENKFENGTFDKLEETDFDNLVPKSDYQIEVKLNMNFN
jgi:hypothetical protein